jgi:hypothetical protein
MFIGASGFIVTSNLDSNGTVLKGAKLRNIHHNGIPRTCVEAIKAINPIITNTAIMYPKTFLRMIAYPPC